MVNINVPNAELSYIYDLVVKHNVTISRSLRNIVYTYFAMLKKGNKVQQENLICFQALDIQKLI